MRIFARSEVQTIGVAFVVTLLIWLWAEGQNVARRPLSVQVIFPELAGGDLLLDTGGDGSGGAGSGGQSGFDGAVRLVFEGSTAALERVEELRGQVLVIPPGSPGLPVTAGVNQVVNLMTALRAHPDIVGKNATLTVVEPDTVVVSTTKLSSRELPVRVELARTISLDGEPRPSMVRVRVRVPEAQAGRLTEGAYAVAYVSEDQIVALGEGASTVTGELRLPAAFGEFEPRVRFQPEQISVALRVREALESVKLPMNVPVWLAMPPTERTDKWEIEVLDKFLADVAVSGRPEQIAKLSLPGVTIKAVVEIGSEDLNRALEAIAAAALPAVSTNSTGTEPPVSNGAAPLTAAGVGNGPNGAVNAGTGPTPNANGAATGPTSVPAASPVTNTAPPGIITKSVVFTGLPTGVTPVGQAPQVRVRIGLAGSVASAAANGANAAGSTASATGGMTPPLPSTNPAPATVNPPLVR